jgi:ZIP family zinc transporter
MKKTSIFLLISIFIHNFFEGMAIGIAGIADYGVSIIIGIAIAIHKIPEGLCTSIPYYYATKNKFKALGFSALTAIPIPIGFFAAFFLFKIIPLQVSGALIGFTAGIMIHIASHELIPSSTYKVTKTNTLFSFMAGIILVIILSAIKI